MIEQPFNLWRMALRQDMQPRLVIVLNLRLAKHQGMPDAFFDEVGLLLDSFDDVQGAWTRAGPYEYALAPAVNERSALEFTMRLRTGVRVRYAHHALKHNVPDLDQAKAIQPFTWPSRKNELNEALRGLLEVQAGEGAWRPLALNDVQALRDILPAFTAQEWKDKVMTAQTAVFIDQDRRAKPWVKEHYCRIAQVRQLIDPGIDLRNNDLLFALLLGCLDLKVMETAPLWMAEGRWSVNLSVNTILSRDFAVFADTNALRGGMVEIKQSDLMMQYHRANRAIATLRDLGVAVCVDLVWADSLGLIAYEKIPGISAVKIPWQPQQAERMVAERPVLRRWLEHGMVPVLTRVSEAPGVELGLKLGIRAFQGQYVSQEYGTGDDKPA